MRVEEGTLRASRRIVFVAAAHEDHEVAMRLIHGLSAKGLDIWYAPRDLEAGEQLPAGIEDVLLEASWYVLLVSPAALNSSWINFEVGVALGQGKRVIPVWLSHEAVAQAPEVLSGLQGISLSGGVSDSDLSEVARRIARTITRSETERTRYHVEPRGPRWFIVGDRSRVAGTYSTRAEATRRAILLAQGQELGEVVIHSRDGRVQSQKTYGRNPRSRRAGAGRSRFEWESARPAEEGRAMRRTERHVVPDPRGGWAVVKPGSSRPSALLDTQAQAINRAKRIVGNAGGGEVVIHRANGTIRDSDTVAPGHDPFPPRDRR